ncbi:MAG: radical SAM protein [Campylobacterales bacterium]|nr:radical SAM protein [Campylobacterales bacterium]
MGHLYTKYKIFHFQDKLDSLPLENSEIKAPLHIRIKPTNVCNHNCWYCAYKVDNLQLGQDMVERDFIPKEKMLEIIDDCAEMGVKAITFSGGGEPFVYKYMIDAAKKLSQTNISFASLTNGAKLTGEAAEIFAHHGTWVRVSMDGWSDDSYAEHRGVKFGEFSKIIQNMTDFKKLGGKCYLGVSVVVGQKNAEHIYELIAKLRDTGIDSVKVAPCIVGNTGCENNRYHEPIFDIVKEQTARAMTDFSSDQFEIYDSYHTQLDSFEKAYHWCPYSQILMVIGADLNIYPCQDKAYNLDTGLIGDIKDMRFKDWWFSDKNNFFKIDPSKVCNHHCVADGKNKMILEYLDADKAHLGFV